jgi:uncharacterized phage-associated protein
MNLQFNEVKATQVAAHLLRLRGKRMSYLKLIKLLYLADREALLRWGRPITTDRYVSMDHGPVVSRIYALISNEPEPDDKSFWHAHIVTTGWDARLVGDPSDEELSQAELDLLEEIYAKHGAKSRWQIRDETHNLPEWKDPEGSSLPITYEDIFRAGDKPSAEIVELAKELESLIIAEKILSPR